MNIFEILLYSLEFLVFCTIIYYSNLFKSFEFASKRTLVFLFFINCLVCLFNAFFDNRDDILLYFEESKILHQYLYLDFWNYYDILFKKGGGFIPSSIAEPLFKIGHWGNPSMYFMVKSFTWFSLFSTTNIYNISLFFSVSSFVSKYFVLRILTIYKPTVLVFYIALMLLFLGGVDSYFVTGMYKENFVFLFLSYFLFYFLTSKTVVKTSLFLLFLYYSYLIKPHILIIVYFGIGIYYMDIFIRKKQFFYNLIVGIGLIFNLIVLKYFNIFDKILIKKAQFNSMNIGNTKKEVVELTSSLDSFLIMIKSILGVFYTSLFSINNSFKFIMVDINNIVLVLLILVLLFKSSVVNKVLFYYGIAVFCIIFFFIGVMVPNFGSQLRYRSVYIIILILLINSKLNIRKNYI